MSTLRDIRRQLVSVENIKKITNTMERVAAARLRHAQAKAEESRPYISKMKEILERVAGTGVSHPLFEQSSYPEGEVKKIGLVVMSSNRGLSGSYNSNVLQAADHFLKRHFPEQVELILLGRKAVEYYHQKKWTIRLADGKGLDSRIFTDIVDLSHQMVNWFLSGDLDEIWLLYTHYISVAHRKVVLEKFLNIEKPEGVKSSMSYIYEPSPEEILTDLLPRYCVTRIQTALHESYASELGARIIAMQTATKNSEEMIEQLTLKKNKTRQRDITREMIEITTGANI